MRGKNVLASFGVLGSVLVMSVFAQHGGENAASPKSSASPAPLSCQDNAAFLYYKAWAWFPLPQQPGLTWSQEKAAEDWKPTAEMIGFLYVNQMHIDVLLQATPIEHADFDVDSSNGPATLLPHIGLMRKSAEFLGVDARRYMSEKNKIAAADRIEAIYRIGSHIAESSQSVIETLTALTIRSIADDHTDLLISTGNLTTNARETLLREAQRSNASDAIGIKHGFACERSWYLPGGAFYDRWKGAAAGRQFADYLREHVLGDTDAAFRKHTPALQRLNGDQLNTEFDSVAKVYADVIAAWDQPNAEELLETIAKDIEAGAYGTVAKFSLPRFRRDKQLELTRDKEHTQLIERLERAEVDDQPADAKAASK